jgi:light-regulated signal transduction histidine kinase (bacteriophytochrome)
MENILKDQEAEIAFLRQKLEEKSKEFNDFSYIISHDLKAPLRAISSLVNWLKSDYGDKFDEEGFQFLELLVDRVHKMDKLIECILKYSRLSNNFDAKIQIDLNAYIKNIIETIVIPENIVLKVDTPLPTITASEESISQVFHQLIKNAIQFMDKPESQIHIGCVEEGQNYKFYVQDNGPGIEAKYHEKIFEIFQSLRPVEGPEITGMGLTIAKKIISTYNGKIWLESTPNEGSTFYFTLPKLNKEEKKD